MGCSVLFWPFEAEKVGGSLNCSKCGVEVAEGAAYCSACGEPQFGQPRAEQVERKYNLSADSGPQEAALEEDTPPDAVPDDVAPEGEALEGPRTWEPRATTSAPRFVYAGFWLRLAAYVIEFSSSAYFILAVCFLQSPYGRLRIRFSKFPGRIR